MVYTKRWILMDLIKGFMGLAVGVPLAGAAMGAVGTHMVGAARGIGQATQSMIGIGLLGHASKLFKW